MGVSNGMDVRVVSNLIKRKLHQIEPPPQDADEFTDLQGQMVHFLRFDHREREVFQRELSEEEFLHCAGPRYPGLHSKRWRPAV